MSSFCNYVISHIVITITTFKSRYEYLIWFECQDVVRYLLNSNLYIAYVLKEQVLDIFDEENEAIARKRLQRWFENVAKAGIEQLQEVVKTIQQYIYGVYNYFKHRLTNAQSEGFNNKINVIKRRAYGFRDLEYFKLKILQSCGLRDQTNP